MIVSSRRRPLSLDRPVEPAAWLWRSSSRSLRTPALTALIVAALVLAPFLAGALGVSRGLVFTGTLKALGDEGEYMAALNAGAHGDWLWHDPFMAQPPPPILMYPTYLFFGHLGAWLSLSVPVTYALMHVVAALALLGALWLLASTALPAAHRPWFVAFALGVSGLYWLDALLAMEGHAPASLAWMGMPPLSGLTSALMGVHETLGTSGQVLVLAAVLQLYGSTARGVRWRATGCGAVGTLLIGLTMPMLLPVTVAAVGAFVLWHGWRSRSLAATLSLALPMSVVLVPGLVVAAYYFWQLSFGPWSASPLRFMGARPLSESLLTWGATLPLGLWGWRLAPAALRPLATVLGLWCCCAVLGMLLPFWQSFRFSTGLNVMVGGLFALGILGHDIGVRQRARLWLLASLGTLMQLLFLFTILVPGRAEHLYLTVQEDQAMRWLAAHVTAQDVVLAPVGFGNRLPSVAYCRTVAGHAYMTFDMPLREQQLQVFYGRHVPVTARMAALRATKATYVVYDAYEADEGSFDPRGLPGLRTAFDAGSVVVLRVNHR